MRFHRIFLVAGALLLLALDGAWWSASFAAGRVEGTELQVVPERMDGRLVGLSLVDVVEVGELDYTVRDGAKRFRVNVEAPHGLELGDEIYLRGVYHHTGREIDETWRELAPARKGKWGLGLLALGLVALGFPLAFQVRRDGLALRG